MPIWLTATLTALPVLIKDGYEAFKLHRAMLMTPNPATSTHAATVVDDDAVLAERRASSTPPAPAPKDHS